MFGGSRKPSRISAWDGPRYATRPDDLPWGRIGHRAVLGRLAVMVLTVAAVTAIVAANGIPLPYRVGEVMARDIRVRVPFELINQPQTERIREEVEGYRQLIGDPVPTSADPADDASSPVQPVVEKYPPGLPLVKRGRPITDGQLALLKEEHKAYLKSLTSRDYCQRNMALFLVHLLLGGLVTLYVARFQPGLAASLPKIVSVCLLVVLTLASALLLSRPPWHAMLIPEMVTAMVLTVAFNPPFALMMALNLAVVTTLALGLDVGHLLIQMGAVSTTVLLLRSVRTRTRLVEVAAAAGVACLFMTVATELLSGQTTKLIMYDAGRHFAWCMLAGFILSGSLPVVERCFGVVTDVTLQELADGSHPLMQELVRRAPGTYTHSMTVALLAEAAAESIGANALLTRVGSYYHDIGKMLKPHYFIENQSGENRHDSLEPALSTLVIIGHVKDGLALGRQYNLPRPILEFIQQHHGTTLVEYFYREAMRQQEANGGGAGELEFVFRYPGPKPQSREIGVVMLADAAETASRALSAPTPNSLRKLVHDLMMKRLLDGQFEESGLTLTELHRVEESICKGLIAVYHARIKYPEEAKAQAN